MIEKLLAPAAGGLGRVDMIIEEIEALLPRSKAGTGKDEGLATHIGGRTRKAFGDESEGIDAGEIGAIDAPGEVRDGSAGGSATASSRRRSRRTCGEATR
jgi:hypothetical protein